MYHIFHHNPRQPVNNTNQDAQHDNKLLFLDVADAPHQKFSQYPLFVNCRHDSKVYQTIFSLYLLLNHIAGRNQ